LLEHTGDVAISRAMTAATGLAQGSLASAARTYVSTPQTQRLRLSVWVRQTGRKENRLQKANTKAQLSGIGFPNGAGRSFAAFKTSQLPTASSDEVKKLKKVRVHCYDRAGSSFSVSMPSSVNAALALFKSNWPSRASRESAAAAIDSALISKYFRRYCLLSLRP
jgi:hypothetical protein